jgi:branched-chain amino acid transport system ATP-binding protein
MPAPLLEVHELSAGYGGLSALHEISLRVEVGDVVAVVGANGAGKTTLLRALSGQIPARAGRIALDGVDLGRLRVEQRVGRGLALVPEGRQLFAAMSVADNLLLGSYARFHQVDRAELEADLERVYGLFPVLRERRRQVAGTLSGGEQQMVAIGRGLMARPRLLLLDEPSLGLAPLLVRAIFAALRQLPAQNTAVLVVEQHVRQILPLANRAYLLAGGAVIRESIAADLAADPIVQRTFLGQRGPAQPAPPDVGRLEPARHLARPY